MKRQTKQNGDHAFSDPLATDQQIVQSARQYIAKAGVARFHSQYTIDKITKKLKDNDRQMVAKIVYSSIKIFKALCRSIESRQIIIHDLLQKINLYADTVEETDILKQDVNSLRANTLKLIKEFGHWLKVVGNDKTKHFWVKAIDSKSSQQEKTVERDYIPVLLTDWRPIVQFCNHVFKDSFAAHPLFLTETEIANGQYGQQNQIIERLKFVNDFVEDKPQEIKQKEKQKEEQKEEQKYSQNDEVVIKDKLQQDDVKKFPDKQYNLELLKKFKNMAGDKKKIGKYYSNSSSSNKNKTLSHQKSKVQQQENQTSKIMEKVQKLKMKVQQETSPKVVAKKSPSENKNNSQNFRTSKIRLIAEMQHDNMKQKNEMQKAMQLTSYSMMLGMRKSSIQLIRSPKKHSKTPSARIQEKSTQKKKKEIQEFIKNSRNRKQQTIKKQHQMEQIKDSLKNIRNKIKSINKGQNFEHKSIKTTNTIIKKSSSVSQKSFYHPQAYLTQDRKLSDPIFTKKSLLFSNKQTPEKIKNLQIQNRQSSQENTKVDKRAQKQIQPAKNQYQVKNLKPNHEGKQINEKTKQLNEKKNQLESIAQDIQNENQQKQEQINLHKMKYKNLEINYLQKMNRIQQLEEQINKYNKVGQSDQSEEEEMASLKMQKKLRTQKFENQKKQVLLQIKQMELKMKKQQSKFEKLKDKEIKVEYQHKESQLSEQNKAIIEELESKTKLLEQSIKQQEAKAKAYQKQFELQLSKNQEIAHQLKKQEELENLLLDQIKKITQQRNAKREKEKKKKIDRLKEEIKELDQAHEKALKQFEMETKNVSSMYESMRLKNIELQEKLRKKGEKLSESSEQQQMPQQQILI